MNVMEREKIAQVARKQLGLVTLEQLRELEISYRQLRTAVGRRELVEVDRFVFASFGVEANAERTALASVLSAGRGAAASHLTAAALHGLPGFSLTKDSVHITVPHARRPDAGNAVVHYTRALPPHHLSPRRTIPVTSVARTIFDLARLLSPQRVERALDNALAMELVTMNALVRVLGDLAGPGRAGTVLMRDLLEARGEGFVVPRSRLERTFLELVHRSGLPEPRREINLGSDTSWNGRVEFVFEHGVHVEVDGRRWHTALLDQDHDHDRDNEFIATGFAPLRFSWRRLCERPAHVVDQIRRALRTAAARASSTRSGEEF